MKQIPEKITSEQLRMWLCPNEYDDNPSAPDWVVDQPSLLTALLSMGIHPTNAKALFRSFDALAIVLNQPFLDQGEDLAFQNKSLMLTGGELCHAELYLASGLGEPTWKGVVEGGNLYLAGVLLVLCMYAYPMDTYGILDHNWFFVNCRWQEARKRGEIK